MVISEAVAISLIYPMMIRQICNWVPFSPFFSPSVLYLISPPYFLLFLIDFSSFRVYLVLSEDQFVCHSDHLSVLNQLKLVFLVFTIFYHLSFIWISFSKHFMSHLSVIHLYLCIWFLFSFLFFSSSLPLSCIWFLFPIFCSFQLISLPFVCILFSPRINLFVTQIICLY